MHACINEAMDYHAGQYVFLVSLFESINPFFKQGATAREGCKPFSSETALSLVTEV